MTRPDGLTPHQREVADLVAAGKTDKEIAAALGIGKHGVWFHIRSIAKAWELRGNVRVQIALRVRENAHKPAA